MSLSQGHIRLDVEENERQVPRYSPRKLLLFLTILGTFVCACLFIHPIVPVVSFSTSLNQEQFPTMVTIDYSKYDIPTSVNIEYALPRQKWTPQRSTEPRFHQAVQSEFELPLSSTNLFVVKTTSGSGKLDILTSKTQAPGTVTVRVLMFYNNEDIFDQLLALRLSRPGGENGVGLFEPKGLRGREDRVALDITVILPESSTAYTIRKLETDVSNMTHRVHDLHGKISFDSISLHGSNGQIHTETLKVTSGSLHTSQGVIKGTFITSTSLKLHTSNAAIDVDVSLENRDNGKETVLDAKTSNGAVKANLTLTSTTGSGGQFNVGAHTSNDKLNIKVIDAPNDSKLLLTAKTSNGRAEVTLHPTYEGSVSLKTSSNQATSRVPKEAVDPKGRGRMRQVKIRKDSRGHLDLDVSWGENKRGNGDVSVHASHGDVILHL